MAYLVEIFQDWSQAAEDAFGDTGKDLGIPIFSRRVGEGT